MCRVVLRSFGYAVVMVALALGMTATPATAQEDDDATRLILAFYHAEYDWGTWSETLCDEPRDLYISADAAAVNRHLLQAQSMGLDAFVQVWYGPDLSDNPTEPNLAMLLRQAAAYDVAAAMVLDMTTDDYLVTGNDVAEALAYLRDEHHPKPAYLRVDGRSVVFFLGQDRLSLASWEAIRNQVDPARGMIWIAEAGNAMSLDVFDGLYLYDIADRVSGNLLTPLQLSRWGGEVRQWESDSGLRRYWVATVFPGYDDGYSLQQDADGDDEDAPIVRAREGGETYRESWTAADESGPDWIVVRSYNEWDLCTHIEPSFLYNSSYLDLTRELIDRYRQPVTPTPVPATPTATPTLTPTITPTVTLPAPVLTETLEATATVTPTATPVPTVTPFRLATPTSTLAPEVVRTRDAGEGPDFPQPALPVRLTQQAVIFTATPIPRLPVEGGSPRRCMFLPLWLTVAVVIGCRRRSHPAD